MKSTSSGVCVVWRMKTQQSLKTTNTPVLLCSIKVFLTLTWLLFFYFTALRSPFPEKSKALLLILILLTCTYFFSVFLLHMHIFLLLIVRNIWVSSWRHHVGGTTPVTSQLAGVDGWMCMRAVYSFKKKLCDLIYGCTDRNAVNKKLFAARTRRAGGFLFLHCCENLK